MTKHQTTNYQFNYWDQFDPYPLYNADPSSGSAANWINLDALLKAGLGFDRLDTAWFKNGLYLPSTLKVGDGFNFPATGFQNLESQTHYHEYDNRVSIHPTAGLVSNYGWDLGASFGKVLVIVDRMTPINAPGASNILGLWVSNSKPSVPGSGISSYPASSYVGYNDSFLFHVGKYDNSGPPPTLTSLGTDSDADSIGYAQAYYQLGDYGDGYALYADGTHVRLFIRRRQTSWSKVVEVSDSTYTQFRYCGFYLITGGTQSACWLNGPAQVYAQ